MRDGEWDVRECVWETVSIKYKRESRKCEKMIHWWEEVVSSRWITEFLYYRKLFSLYFLYFYCFFFHAVLGHFYFFLSVSLPVLMHFRCRSRGFYMEAIVVIMHDRCRKKDFCHSNQDSNQAEKIHDVICSWRCWQNMKKKSFYLKKVCLFFAYWLSVPLPLFLSSPIPLTLSHNYLLQWAFSQFSNNIITLLIVLNQVLP